MPTNRFQLRWSLSVGLSIFLSVSFVLLGAWSAHAKLRRATAAPIGVHRQWRQITRASWYGNEFKGKRTADGTRFNPQHLTAAHRTLKLGTKVKVTDLTSGRSVIVQINDRGPYADGRGIDLSYAAARQLGMVRRGVARVQIETVRNDTPPPPVVAASGAVMVMWLPKAIVA